MQPRRWDIFCRVVDNFGDVGVCWRLAAQLGARGEAVRLWIDDASALQWMAPDGAAGVSVHDWREAANEAAPGEVVIEAFGCALPEPFVARMAGAKRAPCWINLEYLSAEDFVERSHRLASPQFSGPGAGLRKWFFYPGFTRATGGLLREPGLAAQQRAFDAAAWLAAHGAAAAPGERIVSLFCYDQPALPALIAQLSAAPTLLFATAGTASRQTRAILGPGLRRGALRAHLLPLLTQRDYDRLLWSCDLNFVRGEDSFVRAQWAARPFVWQIYPQHDGAHLAKLEAFIARFGAGDDDPALAAMQRFWHGWNAPQSAPLPALPAFDPWRRACERWRDALLMQDDLVTQLLGFVAETG